MSYSKDDLIRKPMVRTIILGLGIIILVVGSKYLAYNGNSFKGFFISILGVSLLFALNHAYEKLLKEKNNVPHTKGDKK